MKSTETRNDQTQANTADSQRDEERDGWVFQHITSDRCCQDAAKAAWDAALQSRDAEVASLKRQIAEDTLALVRASDEIKQLKEAPMARKDG